MWRWMHAIFGSHYVHMRCGCHESVGRVRFTPAGDRYVKWCGTIVFIDKDRSWIFTPLTWREPAPEQKVRLVS